MEIFDAFHLARLQFAFTVSFHIVFPAISIGMASFLAVLEWRYSSPATSPTNPCSSSGRRSSRSVSGWGWSPAS